MSDTDNFLAHYGVKGMKWGVRRDEELMGRIAGYKARGESKETKARYKEYKKSTTRKERRADKRAIIESRGLAVIEDAKKHPLNLMEVGTPGYPTIMQGKEFIEMLGNGAAFNPMTTYITDLKVKVPNE